MMSTCSIRRAEMRVVVSQVRASRPSPVRAFQFQRMRHQAYLVSQFPEWAAAPLVRAKLVVAAEGGHALEAGVELVLGAQMALPCGHQDVPRTVCLNYS